MVSIFWILYDSSQVKQCSWNVNYPLYVSVSWNLELTSLIFYSILWEQVPKKFEPFLYIWYLCVLILSIISVHISKIVYLIKSISRLKSYHTAAFLLWISTPFTSFGNPVNFERVSESEADLNNLMSQLIMKMCPFH